jgi:hypothetical protein
MTFGRGGRLYQTEPEDRPLTRDELLQLIGNPPTSREEEDRDAPPDLIGGFPQSYLQQPLPGRPAYGPYIPRAVNRYFEYDQWRFASRSPEYIVALQNQMVAAGLVDARDIIPGLWTDPDADAMKVLMIEATAARTTWENALGARIASGAGAAQARGAGRTFVTPTYMAPDYATLSQAVKGTFAQLVGREPKDYELSLLADQLAADSRAEYEAVVAGQRAEFRAGAGGDDLVGDRIVGGATVQAVDPMARLQEAIQNRFGAEIAAEEAEQDYTANTRLMAQNLAGLSGVIGG